MEYAAPLAGDFTATAVRPPEAWDRFLATLARHRRARITVPASVASGDVVGGRHEGTYAVLRG
jgi:thioesterase domain-containing protein